MKFDDWEKIDPHLLVGLANTELRNVSESLEDFLKTHDISELDFMKRLSEFGYDYFPDQKQFR
ncbi:MAG: DUF4250 domain-containing protein [Akkermansiaceae bacterium]